MLKKSKRPILVTGSLRSGTTWVGRMIGLCPDVAYIHEPFNANINNRLFLAQFEYDFVYVTDKDATQYHEPLRRLMMRRPDLLTRLSSRTRTPKDIRNAFVDSFRLYRWRRLRPLVKDPIAIFSAEWLAKSFDMQPIVIIRHPAAIVSSILDQNWDSDFKVFLRQKSLMQGILHPLEAKIRQMEKTRSNNFDWAIGLWNIVHYVILIYQEKHPDWRFVRYEDVALDPLSGFENLYAWFDLDFDTMIRNQIQFNCTSSKAADVLLSLRHYMMSNWKAIARKRRLALPAIHSTHRSVMRDSKAMVTKWKPRLTEQQVEQIKERTWDIAKEFYSSEDW